MHKSLLLPILAFLFFTKGIKSQEVMEELSMFNQFKLYIDNDTLKLTINGLGDTITLKSKTTLDSVIVTPIETNLKEPSFSHHDPMFNVFGYKNGEVSLMLWYNVDGPFYKYYEVLNNKVVAQACYGDNELLMLSKTIDTIFINEYDELDAYNKHDKKGGVNRENKFDKNIYFTESQSYSYVFKKTILLSNKKIEYHFNEKGDTIFISSKTYSRSKNILKKIRGRRNNGFWVNVHDVGYVNTKFPYWKNFFESIDSMIAVNEIKQDFFYNETPFCSGDYLDGLSPFVDMPINTNEDNLVLNKSLLKHLWNNWWSSKEILPSFEEYVENKKKKKYFLLGKQ